MSQYPFYPETLRSIINILEGLNDVDNKPKLEGGDGAVQLRPSLEIVNVEDDDAVIGYAKDVVGGAWHFEPVLPS